MFPFTYNIGAYVIKNFRNYGFLAVTKGQKGSSDREVMTADWRPEGTEFDPLQGIRFCYNHMLDG